MKQLSVKFPGFQAKRGKRDGEKWRRRLRTDGQREELIRSITTKLPSLRLNPFRNYQFPRTVYLLLICLSQLDDFFYLLPSREMKRMLREN